MTSNHTKIVFLALLGLPCAAVTGFLGGTLAGGGAPAPPEMPAVRAEPAAPVAPLVAPTSDVEDRLASRLAEVERALGELRLATAGSTAERPRSLTPPGQIQLDDIQAFQRLQRGVARYQSIRERQSMARKLVERIVVDADLDDAGKAHVSTFVDNYLAEELPLLQVDRNELDDFGRGALDHQREMLRQRSLADLARLVDANVARAVVDQLWVGRAPGKEVVGQDSLRRTVRNALGAPGGDGSRPGTVR